MTCTPHLTQAQLQELAELDRRNGHMNESIETVELRFSTLFERLGRERLTVVATEKIDGASRIHFTFECDCALGIIEHAYLDVPDKSFID